jgi:inner membrane protein
MRYGILFKLAAIGGIVILLMIPLMQIHGLVRERQAARDSAVADIARGTGLAQVVTGPVLVVPAVRTVRTWVEDAVTRQRRAVDDERHTNYYFLPERLEFNGELTTEQRRRGIYEARLFRATNRLSGHFVLPAVPEGPEDNVTVRLGRPWLAVGMTDIRGIGTGLALRVNGADTAIESGTAVGFLGAGVHAPLPEGSMGRLDFELDLPLQGTGQFSVTPVGRETLVSLKSDWPHPSFMGDFLPVTRSVTASGFQAQWQTSFFATNLLETVRLCAADATCRQLTAPTLGVSIIDPVDQYLKTERAIKYALLFIALTFAGFLLCEVLKRAAVHPVQYGLVGLALALFFLLLLSLAEHVGFGAAYLVSASACVGLLGYYLVHVLRSATRGLGFAGGLALLYALLYGILSAEDYALLLGALLLFGVLALFMVLTRRVDWSQHGAAR